MTKLLITEKLITNKQDFINFSNISETVEFIKYSDFSSNTTVSLFEENNIKFIYDQFVNFRDLSNELLLRHLIYQLNHPLMLLVHRQVHMH